MTLMKCVQTTIFFSPAAWIRPMISSSKGNYTNHWATTLLFLCLVDQVFDIITQPTIWATTWQNQQSECAPAKTQISLGIRPVLSESSLSAWRNLGPLATYWAHSEDSDQTGRMPRLIWGFAGHTLTLLDLQLSHVAAHIRNINWSLSNTIFAVVTDIGFDPVFEVLLT